MAIDYTTSNTGIFDRIGKIVKYVNSRKTAASTSLPAELKAIADKFEAADMTTQISGLYDAYDSMRRSVVGERKTLAKYVDAVLTDRASVLNELRVSTPDTSLVLPELYRQMVVDSESIDASSVSIGSVTADATNQGNGMVLMSKLLDGTHAPTRSGVAVIQYAGTDSQLACNETMSFTCVADAPRDGTAEGSERFAWSGGIEDEIFGYKSGGSGDGPSLTVCGESNIITNGNFQSWASNVPSGWTITAGTAGTHVKQSTSQYYRGSSSLHFDGDGSATTFTVTQALNSRAMKSRTLYCVSLRLKASASTGTGAFLCSFTGSGYTASSTEKIAITAGSMPTAWTLYEFWIVTPAVIPSDWTLVISNTGTPGGTSNVYVDCVAPCEASYHGGLAAVIVPGDDQFAVGDRFTVDITNDGEGVFQEFFREWYGVQLPSDSGGSETIADTLAT